MTLWSTVGNENQSMSQPVVTFVRYAFTPIQPSPVEGEGSDPPLDGRIQEG